MRRRTKRQLLIVMIILLPILGVLGYLGGPIVNYYFTCAKEVETWDPSRVFDIGNGSELPQTPGVYYAPNSDGKVVKVGKKLHLYTWDEIQKIAPGFAEEFFAVEQKDFRTDWFPISPTGITRAFITDVEQGRAAAGGGTITQMLTRMLWVGYDKTLDRKQREVAYAFRLDAKYSREQQFAMLFSGFYLGTFGGEKAIGFPRAAKALFGKEIGQLNAVQRATLIALANGPGALSPTKTASTKRRLINRRNLVLKVLHDDKLTDRNGLVVSDDQLAQFQASPLKVKASAKTEKSSKDNWSMVVDTAKKSVRKHLGLASDDKSVDQDVIVTKLRERMQRILAQAFASKLQSGMNGVAIVMDPETGEVFCLYGGNTSSNHIISLLAPGSLDKTFAYAKAVEDGKIKPDSTFLDAKKEFVYSGGKKYTPPALHPYTGQMVTVRDAFAHSNNGIALQVGEMVGWANLVSFFKEMDLESHNEKGIGKLLPVPTLPMGVFETTPGQLVAALAAVANGGTRVSPRYVDYVRTVDGKTYGDDKFASEKKEVFSSSTADTMLSLMQGVTATGGTGEGVYADGYVGAVAGKTGSSTKYGWFGGAVRGKSRKLVFVVGVGYDSAKGKTKDQLAKVFGGTLAVPVVSKFLADLQDTGEFSEYLGENFDGTAVSSKAKEEKATDKVEDVDMTTEDKSEATQTENKVEESAAADKGDTKVEAPTQMPSPIPAPTVAPKPSPDPKPSPKASPTATPDDTGRPVLRRAQPSPTATATPIPSSEGRPTLKHPPTPKP